MTDIGWVGNPEQVARGCSLGNPDCFLRADREANLDGIWLPDNSRWYSGELSLSIPASEKFVWEQVEFAPAHQSARYRRADGASYEKRIFVPLTGATAYLWIQGEGFSPRVVEVVCDWRVGAARSESHRAQPGPDCERQWYIQISPQQVQGTPRDEGQDTQSLWTSHPLTHPVVTEPHRVRFTLPVPISPKGRLDAWVCLTLQTQNLSSPPPPEPAITYQAVAQALDKLIGVSSPPCPPILGGEPLPSTDQFPQDWGLGGGSQKQGATLDTRHPTPSIERVCAWGKIGSWRVWHRYGTGDWGFTNDPPGNTVVTRDVAWFMFGTDYFAPHWSRELLTTLARHAVYPGGKIAEFVRLAVPREKSEIRPPTPLEKDDYGLNLNDATPLFVLAVEHHWRLTQEQKVLEQFYPVARDAAHWILRQKREDGLIWCDGKKTNVLGIAGWRNIIPGYRLSGAVTELNAECVAALRAVSRLAEAVGDSVKAQQFQEESTHLSEAMSQLVNPETGMFFLNRDENGANPQLAIDLALPALLQAGPEEARVRTLLRLVEDDFRGPFGLLCLSRNDPAFHPRFGWGLMGGSWPNATAWAAAALAPYHLSLAWELTEQMASTLFPETWIPSAVSVPGQFPEWFEGDTGRSSGMSLSPWMPATFVWLVQEGLQTRFQ